MFFIKLVVLKSEDNGGMSKTPFMAETVTGIWRLAQTISAAASCKGSNIVNRVRNMTVKELRAIEAAFGRGMSRLAQQIR